MSGYSDLDYLIPRACILQPRRFLGRIGTTRQNLGQRPEGFGFRVYGLGERVRVGLGFGGFRHQYVSISEYVLIVLTVGHMFSYAIPYTSRILKGTYPLRSWRLVGNTGLCHMGTIQGLYSFIPYWPAVRFSPCDTSEQQGETWVASGT